MFNVPCGVYFDHIHGWVRTGKNEHDKLNYIEKKKSKKCVQRQIWLERSIEYTRCSAALVKFTKELPTYMYIPPGQVRNVHR